MLLGSIAAVLFLLLLDIGSGAASLGWSDIWRAISAPGNTNEPGHFIVWNLRLPQALMAMAAGAALGLAGAEMQTVLDNPLASPFTLGVSSAAALGAALSLSLGVHLPGIPAQHGIALNAFAMAMACSLFLDRAAGKLALPQHGIEWPALNTREAVARLERLQRIDNMCTQGGRHISTHIKRSIGIVDQCIKG